MKNRILSLLNLTGFLAMVIVNALANILPINGQNTGEISDRYPNLFVPPGFTFSIWGVIYLLLLLFVTYQLVQAFRKDGTGAGFIGRTGLLFFISCLANLGWILAWHFGLLTLSLAIMLILFASLLSIYLRLGVGKVKNTPAIRYLVYVPFSVYLGWISIATIVNVAVVLVDTGWSRFGLTESFWTVAMLGAGALITLLMLLLRRDPFFALVAAWAYLGIWIRHAYREAASASSSLIATVTLVLLGIILLTALVVTIYDFRFTNDE